ncbi:MAG: hypothetical protein ACJ73L_08040 [Actinomycetes bacterium]
MHLRARDLLEAVHWVANDQLGLITAAQLEEIGVLSSTLARRARTGGAWRRVLPGTYQVADGPMSIEQREMAALLFTGSHGVLTGASGMRRWGLTYLPQDPIDAYVHTLIPLTRHRKSSGFVVVERTKRLPTPTTVDALPVAPLARCIVDAGRRNIDRRTTRAFLLEAVQREMVGVEEIAHELSKAQRRGTALLRECVEEARAGVRSAPEAELRELMLRAGFGPTLWNPVLRLPTRKFVAQPDGLIKESMTVIEVQSKQYHGEGDRFVATLNRATNYGALGLLVVHVVPSEMRRDPNATLRQIWQTHRRGLERPLPTLIVEDARGRRPSAS